MGPLHLNYPPPLRSPLRLRRLIWYPISFLHAFKSKPSSSRKTGEEASNLSSPMYGVRTLHGK
ncbi:hypothetical protein FA13DRAFT_1738442 [Coprinellus micaceus]|uniref:Uncharacterized protein n=1 Tax=Coprinellus micaceus TaxID=71717 RepID=A0A4Y7SU03_COPMI|nr:hypothetical protein FA13DRAFT_1738442 [Coprinellus micaceus]